MLIEATQQPIRYRLQSGVEVLLPPGVPIELSDEAGRQLVKKAGSKVRVVESANGGDGDLIGRLVTWDSPLFGLLSATVQEDLQHGVRVFHPLTEEICVIPKAWLQRTEPR